MFKLTCSSQQDRVTGSSNRIKVVALWNVGGACTGLTCGTLQERVRVSPVERCKKRTGLARGTLQHPWSVARTVYGSHLWNVARSVRVSPVERCSTRGALQGRVRVSPVERCRNAYGSHPWNAAGARTGLTCGTSTKIVPGQDL